MTTDFRALCVELTDCLEKADWPHRYKVVFQQWTDIAHAALAEADGPAVPDDRKPASVATQPSDTALLESGWRMTAAVPTKDEAVALYSEVMAVHNCQTLGDMAEHFARAVLARWARPAAAPVPVSERLPGPNTKVLAHYFNCLGKGRTICAIWVPAKSRSDDYGDDDFTEYDEEDDKFYWPEGWYEVIENWDELGWVKVDEGEIAYWQPLPKWPANALPLPAPEETK